MVGIKKEREAFEIAYSEIFSPIVKRPYPVLENGDYKYIEIDQAWKLWQAKSQSVPEGFVLVPKVISDEWMEVFVEQKLSEYCKSYEGLPFSVKDDELPDLREGFRLPIRNAHKRLMLVLEAQEQSHESN